MRSFRPQVGPAYALISTLEPSSTNNVGYAVSSPRCCRSSNSSVQNAAFSVAP